jgi:hypothetical protein
MIIIASARGRKDPAMGQPTDFGNIRQAQHTRFVYKGDAFRPSPATLKTAPTRFI